MLTKVCSFCKQYSCRVVLFFCVHMVHIVNLNPIENGVYILVEVSFLIDTAIAVSGKVGTL